MNTHDIPYERRQNMGNWTRVELLAENGMFVLAPPEQLDHIPIRENLWYVRSGGENLSKNRGVGDCWVLYEPNNGFEIIWFNRRGDSSQPEEDICRDIADWYCESTGYQDMIPLSEINFQIKEQVPEDGLVPTAGAMNKAFGMGVPNQQTIPMPPPPNMGQDWYHMPPPPPPPTPMNGYPGPPPSSGEGYTGPWPGMSGMGQGYPGPKPRGRYPGPWPANGQAYPRNLSGNSDNSGDDSNWKKAFKWGSVIAIALLTGFGLSQK